MKASVGLFTAALSLVLGVAIVAAGPSGDSPPSAAALSDIPADLLPRYVGAAATCPGLPWQILAAIGFIESHHAQGRADPTTGGVSPHILGPALDGTDGTARIADESSPDGWMHAQGPMQFLPTTWSRWARLAPGRPAGTVASPHNAWDAIYSAAAYLCADRPQLENLDAAILSYNHSQQYLRAVLDKATEYGMGTSTGDVVADELTCPVAGHVTFTDDWGAPRSGGRTHLGTDLFAPYGTPLVAIENGVVYDTTDVEEGLGGIALWLQGDPGTLYYYAHNSVNVARAGDRVTVGQVVAYVGDTGNARGGPPHVHLQLHPNGGNPLNPYPTIARLCR
jgi:hypothetical protein